MKTVTRTYSLCRYKNRPDAACRLPMCKMCGKVMGFRFADSLCPKCARLTGAAKEVKHV